MIGCTLALSTIRNSTWYVFSSILTLAITGLQTTSLAALPAEPSPADYEVVEVMALGTELTLCDVNDLGIATGYYKHADGNYRGFIVQNGPVTELPALGGLATIAAAINNRGEIVGAAAGSNGKLRTALWTGGDPADLLGITEESSAVAISEDGQVVGYINMQLPVPFSYDDGVLVRLPLPAGFSTGIAYSVNSAGVIAGYIRASLGGYPYHAVKWEKQTDGSYALVDIGFPGLMPGQSPMSAINNSIALSINEPGVIVGSAAVSNNYHHFFRLAGSQMEDLGAPPGFASGGARANNNFGEITGEYNTGISGGGVENAFIWREAAGLRNLNTLIPSNSGWVLNRVGAMNNRGHIVGKGTFGGQTRGFILEPAIPRSVFLTQPRGTTINTGQEVSLTAGFAGTGEHIYQWYRNGTALSEQTVPSLRIQTARGSDSGEYYLAVRDATGTYTSESVQVIVLEPPSITDLSSNLRVPVGGHVSLSVEAEGTTPLSFQWLFNGEPIPFETGSTLTFHGIEKTRAGTYRVIVSNVVDRITSREITLDVLVRPTLGLKTYAGLWVIGEAGQKVRIEYAESPEGANPWKLLTTITLSTDREFYVDHESPNSSARLYRAVLE